MGLLPKIEKPDIEDKTITYYAHHMSKYNSFEEEVERIYLDELFTNVKCPNKDLSLGKDMNNYLAYIRDFVGILVASTKKGYIGKGVYLEILEAKKCNIPTLVMVPMKRETNQLFTLRVIKNVEINDTTDWKEKYARIIC